MKKILLVLGFCLLGSAPASVTAAPPQRPPNIVFIMVDDMGWADLGCFGSKAIATANLDRMAAEGMRFTQAYSGCTVCAPARSVLMTGYHMGHTSVRGNTGGIPLRDEDVTVAEVLHKVGYATGGFGKWGLGDLDTPGVPEKQGFDTFFGYYHQVHAHYYYPDYLIDTGKKVPLPGNAGFYDNKPGVGFFPARYPKTANKRQYSQYLIFERTLEFIRANKDRPFFCYVPWTPPHARYEMPADDPAVKLYADRAWSKKAKVIAAMDTMIDRQVGAILDLLKELHLDQQTIVFFCSDQGAAARMDGELNSCGPLRGFKRSMTEGGLRTPLIARWPGKIKPGTVSDHPCYFGDMMATFADLAGAQKYVPDDVDSISLVPTLLGQAKKQQQHAFLYWEWPRYNWNKGEYIGMMQALRQGNWKILRQDARKPWQLYDLSNDLGEKNNLAEKRPDLVKKLAKLAGSAHTDPRPQKEPAKPKGQRYR
jgi:arylsulfatase A-like enzyme